MKTCAFGAHSDLPKVLGSQAPRGVAVPRVRSRPPRLGSLLEVARIGVGPGSHHLRPISHLCPCSEGFGLECPGGLGHLRYTLGNKPESVG